MSATSDGSLEFFNQAWQQYTGLAGNGRAWTDSVHPDDVTHLLDYWNSAEPQGIEARLRGQDGEYALFQIRRRAVVDASGLIIRWYGTASGASSHRAEPGAVINTIPTLAWSTTPEGLADFLNRRWLDYTGLSLDQALGYGWTGPVHPDDVSGIISYWQSLITSGGLGGVRSASPAIRRSVPLVLVSRRSVTRSVRPDSEMVRDEYGY